MIIIQYITVKWNKNHRGGEEAQLRNNLPKAFSLPVKACFCNCSKDVSVHGVSCSSYNGFKKQEWVQSFEFGKIKLGGIDLKKVNEILSVSFLYSKQYCGLPTRYHYICYGNHDPLHEEAFQLTSEEYGRLEFNGRFSDIDTGDWWYEQKTINIIDTERIHKNMFIDRTVQHSYQQFADLR